MPYASHEKKLQYLADYRAKHRDRLNEAAKIRMEANRRASGVSQRKTRQDNKRASNPSVHQSAIYGIVDDGFDLRSITYGRHMYSWLGGDRCAIKDASLIGSYIGDHDASIIAESAGLPPGCFNLSAIRDTGFCRAVRDLDEDVIDDFESRDALQGRLGFLPDAWHMHVCPDYKRLGVTLFEVVDTSDIGDVKASWLAAFARHIEYVYGRLTVIRVCAKTGAATIAMFCIPDWAEGLVGEWDKWREANGVKTSAGAIAAP